MKSFKYRLATAITSGAILFGTMVPSVFATDLEISGNGPGSNNTINVTHESNCTVNQTSNTTVGAVVFAGASTGDNSANNTTNGSVNITTGNASANASVNVTGGDNIAVNPCCCQPDCNGEGTVPLSNSGTSGIISGNGSGSKNEIKATKKKKQSVKQKSNTSVGALVGAKAKTGKNKSDGTTGGSVNLNTGKAESDASLDVQGGSSLINP